MRVLEIPRFYAGRTPSHIRLAGNSNRGGFSVYYFADRLHAHEPDRGCTGDMQLAMLRITEEVRLAHSLEIKEYDLPWSFPVEKDPDDVHYLYSAGGTIFLTTKQGSRVILQGDPETGFEIVFGRVETKRLKRNRNYAWYNLILAASGCGL